MIIVEVQTATITSLIQIYLQLSVQDFPQLLLPRYALSVNLVRKLVHMLDVAPF
jgi:hypothetical protein